jgi:predicted DNA-binding protein (MmcQ/YjbR family)
MEMPGWLDFCLQLGDAVVDYPFGEGWTVLRHPANRRCFAYFFERQGIPAVNLKCDPMEAEFLRSVYSGVQPGYHMNKRHWNTVLLDGSVPENEVQSMIAQSFRLTGPKSAGY